MAFWRLRGRDQVVIGIAIFLLAGLVYADNINNKTTGSQYVINKNIYPLTYAHQQLEYINENDFFWVLGSLPDKCNISNKFMSSCYQAITYLWDVTGIGPYESCMLLNNDEWLAYRNKWAKWYVSQQKTKYGVRKAAFDKKYRFKDCTGTYSLNIQIELDRSVSGKVRIFQDENYIPSEWDYDPNK